MVPSSIHSRRTMPRFPRLSMGRVGRSLSAILGTAAIVTLSAAPSWATDPFRATNPRAIDDQTELAFETMFRDGDYVTAQDMLASADPDEPLSHAMSSAFSYLDEDWNTLKRQSEQTLAAAERLADTDPLRSHLYSAVGHFMEGGYIFSTAENTITIIPRVFSKLNQVLSNIRAAAAIDATDPELNLIKGYMDLIIAVNLPSSDPEEAIARLEAYGAPDYLVKRGIAIAYRDLEEHDNALTYVDEALDITSSNPDLWYLRGQILRNKAEDLDEGSDGQMETLQESVRSFRRAFRNHDLMPPQLAESLGYEFCRAQDRLNKRDRNCRDWAEKAIAEADATMDPANEDR